MFIPKLEALTDQLARILLLRANCVRRFDRSERGGGVRRRRKVLVNIFAQAFEKLGKIVIEVEKLVNPDCIGYTVYSMSFVP